MPSQASFKPDSSLAVPTSSFGGKMLQNLELQYQHQRIIILVLNRDSGWYARGAQSVSLFYSANTVPAETSRDRLTATDLASNSQRRRVGWHDR